MEKKNEIESYTAILIVIGFCVLNLRALTAGLWRREERQADGHVEIGFDTDQEYLYFAWSLCGFLSDNNSNNLEVAWAGVAEETSKAVRRQEIMLRNPAKPTVGKKRVV